MFKITGTRSLLAGAAMLVAGCGAGMTDTNLTTQLLSVTPRSGTVGVSTAPDIVLTFNHSMMAGMEQYMALHQGGITGPVIPMTCNWSDSDKTLTCRPNRPLNPSTAYTIHMGGGMMDAGGNPVGWNSTAWGWADSGLLAA
jgi:hypothetical protein